MLRFPAYFLLFSAAFSSYLLLKQSNPPTGICRDSVHVIIFTFNQMLFYRVETEQQKTEVQIKLEQTHTPSRTPVCGEVDYRGAW